MLSNIPLEISATILSSLNARSIFSYIRTNKDFYERALYDRFWIGVNHNAFQDVFYLVAHHGYFDLLERMLYNPYQIIDNIFLHKVQLYMALNRKKEELDLITDYLENNEIYEIDIRKEIENIVQKIKERSISGTELEDHFVQLSSYYYSDYLGRAISLKLEYEEYKWLVEDTNQRKSRYYSWTEENKDLFFSSFISALVYFRRFDEVKELILIEHNTKNQWVNDVHDEDLEEVVFYNEIVKYATLDFYYSLSTIDIVQEFLEYHEERYMDALIFVSNPDLYKHLLRVAGKSRYVGHEKSSHDAVIEAGYALDPYVWLDIIKEKLIILSEEQIDIILSNAYDAGFDYFYEIILSYKSE